MMRSGGGIGVVVAPAYLRKSRAEEGEDIAGVLARHRASLEETARTHGIVISEYYEEVVSGESLYARPEMLRLLEGVETGKYDAVLCMDIDRLGRGGMRDQGVILDAFRMSETLIITPDKVYDLSDDDDEEMTEFKAFFARREYKMIRKRMTRGLMRTIAEGGYVANAPYGYRKAKIGKLPSLEIVPEEAEHVRYMFRRYLEGAGSATIADEVNAMGAKPNRSAKWSRNSVRGVLRNPTYYGVVPWNRVKRVSKAGERPVARHMPPDKWQISQGVHEPIIDKETYDKAQDMRDNRRIPSLAKYTGEVRNPMAGLLKCSNCGKNVQMMGKSKGIPYILCNTKGCCAGAKHELVEAALLQALERDLKRLELEISEGKSRNTEAISSAIASMEQELARQSQRRDALYEYLEDGTYSREEFAERRAKVDDRISEIQARKNDMETRLAALRGDYKEKLVKQLKLVLALYRTEDLPGKNRLLKSVINYVIYRKEKKTGPSDFTLTVYLKSFL